MTISVKTILSSHVMRNGGRSKTITTLLVTYPLWIHAQMRAHRIIRTDDTGDVMLNGSETFTPGIMECDDLSRNASSNRAVPTPRLITEVSANPAMPCWFGAHEAGMQAHALCNNPVIIDGEEFTAEEAWQDACRVMVKYAVAYHKAGYHKQVPNRLLMPWQHITVVMTADNWDGFFEQRLHVDAEPSMRELARQMALALAAPAMQTLEVGQMHLPFIEDSDWESVIGSYGLAISPERVARFKAGIKNPMTHAWQTYLNEAHHGEPAAELSWCDRAIYGAIIKLSVARCASASYNTVDGFRMDDLRAANLYSRLAEADPMHLSPFEHQALAFDGDAQLTADGFRHFIHGNFSDAFIQFRKLLEVTPSLRTL